MFRSLLLSVLTLAALAPAPAFSQSMRGGSSIQRPSSAAFAAMESINAEHIRAHVRFLSHDLLEGRGTGQRGGDMAAEYIATQFALYGLLPAGENGSYMQKVPMVGITPLPETTFSLVPNSGAAMMLKVLDDYVVYDQTQQAHSQIDAPIVFVGYGIVAPEYHWDDYRGVDVKNKIVLLFVNEPPSRDPAFFMGEALTYYGRWTYKFEEAARHGAAGVLIIHRTDLASYPWSVVKSSWSNEQVYLANDRDPKLEAASWIQWDVARRLFDSAGLKLDAMLAEAATRKFKARELPIRLSGHVVSRVREFRSANVLAMLPGSAGGAPTQALMYSAHYDHLGMDPNLSGDQIYNGAVDNGTGCGILLELARAFTQSGIRPPHPVLFAAVTAEEKGLLGSNYLGKHLPLPAGRIALDLNYDAIPPIGTPESISVAGAERLSFYPVVEKTARAFGYAITADAEPGAGHYYLSLIHI